VPITRCAGPAKTAEGYASGSIGPTTASRMDSYVDPFLQNGGSFVTLAKGHRSNAVTGACKKHGGSHLGSVGGAAAIWRMVVEDFQVFFFDDDKGDDGYAGL